MTRPGEPDATMPVPTGGEPTQPVGGYPGSSDPTQYAGGGGGGERFTGGGDDGDGEEDDNRRKLWMIAGGVLMFGLLVGALIAILAGGGDGEEGTTTSSSSSTSSSTSTSTSTTASTTPPTQAQTPQIVQFTVNQNPVACPSDMSTPNVVLNWSTQNAQSVTISIDNPNGPYGTYAPSGQQSVPFACGVNPLQHTYYLVANGPGNTHSQQKQIQVNGTAPPPTTSTTT